MASSGVAFANECVLTPSDILGPMYNYGAPMFQKKLATDDEPGERLILQLRQGPMLPDSRESHPQRPPRGETRAGPPGSQLASLHGPLSGLNEAPIVSS
jgi:hypothetical protein